MNYKRPTYKGRTWVTNTWNKEFHCAPEAKAYSSGGCTCIKCLIERTIMHDPLAGPAIFNDGEEKEAALVGLYLRQDDET